MRSRATAPKHFNGRYITHNKAPEERQGREVIQMIGCVLCLFLGFMAGFFIAAVLGMTDGEDE